VVEIIRGSTPKPISSKRLADFFDLADQYEGILYIGYPIIGTPEGPFPIDALLISREKGLIIFNLVEGRELGESYREIQDDSANKLEAKLRSHKILMAGRTLSVQVSVVTFVPAVTNLSIDDTYPVCNEDTIGSVLDSITAQNEGVFESVVSVIQTISTIRKGRKKREVKRVDSRGAKLKRLEDSIANLDNLQGRAVIESVEGVQRIRGLAGSGKTIVLALKAAYLHAQHPDWKIAVTFSTRSLKGQLRHLINTFVIEQTNEEPDWDNLHIIHAWGSSSVGDRRGMYYTFCETHSLEYYDFQSARNKFGNGKEFTGACNQALEGYAVNKRVYDAILVDEAQDFPTAFLRICYELLGEEKRLVYAYDELQSLNSQSLPPAEEIFGTNPDGSPRVKLDDKKQDIILEKCYRNSRPVLTTAHALGFGIYRVPDARTGTGLIQIFDQSDLWLDIGYSIVSGSLADGEEVKIARTNESSPRFLEEHSPLSDLVQFHCFDSTEEQAAWVAKSVIQNLQEDELLTDDIVVINTNPLTTKGEVGPIRKILFEKGVNSHLAGVDTSPDVFFNTDAESIVFTGIFRAKGNEAGMIYIINAQDCYSAFGDLSTVRNRLFTAITRSKAWVRVLGVGEGMRRLADEFERLKNNNFELHFTYPTAEVRKQLKVVNRDMTEDEKHRVKKNQSELQTLITDLEAGRIYIEDLGDEQLSRLEALLTRRKKNANS